jgi:hypothetical protein
MPAQTRLTLPIDLDKVVALSPTDRAYIAGFFDGEGSLGLYKKSSGFAAKLSFTQRKPDTLVWLHGIFGGALVTVEGHNASKPYYELRFERRGHILSVLRVILPYLRDKKEQADLLVNFITTDMSVSESDNVVSLLREAKRA